jgi:hypothetical protein
VWVSQCPLGDLGEIRAIRFPRLERLPGPVAVRAVHLDHLELRHRPSPPLLLGSALGLPSLAQFFFLLAAGPIRFSLGRPLSFLDLAGGFPCLPILCDSQLATSDMPVPRELA